MNLDWEKVWREFYIWTQDHCSFGIHKSKRDEIERLVEAQIEGHFAKQQRESEAKADAIILREQDNA